MRVISTRGVTVGWQEKQVLLRFYFDGEISEEDRDSAQIAATEVIADLPDDIRLEEEIIRRDAPERRLDVALGVVSDHEDRDPARARDLEGRLVLARPQRRLGVEPDRGHQGSGSGLSSYNSLNTPRRCSRISSRDLIVTDITGLYLMDGWAPGSHAEPSLDVRETATRMNG